MISRKSTVETLEVILELELKSLKHWDARFSELTNDDVKVAIEIGRIIDDLQKNINNIKGTIKIVNGLY